MRKWFRIVFAILLTAIVGGLIWLGVRPHEPNYEGKPLSFWLAQLQRGTVRPTKNAPIFISSRSTFKTAPVISPATNTMLSSDEYKKVVEAFHNMGSNAMPVLIEMAHAKDSSLKIRCERLLEKQSLIKFHFTPPLEKRIQAIHAMSLVGAPSLPVMREMLKDKETARVAAQALGRMGPEALYPLCEALTNQYKFVRDAAVDSLASLRPDSPARIVGMIEMLKDRDAVNRKNAVLVLGSWGESAKPAISQLVLMLKDEELYVRQAVTNALSAIDPNGIARTGVK